MRVYLVILGPWVLDVNWSWVQGCCRAHFCHLTAWEIGDSPGSHSGKSLKLSTFPGFISVKARVGLRPKWATNWENMQNITDILFVIIIIVFPPGVLIFAKFVKGKIICFYKLKNIYIAHKTLWEKVLRPKQKRQVLPLARLRISRILTRASFPSVIKREP